ncbi:MAG: hypothetical protein MRY21_05985 [Simkaniaceae bacterium]|nr:hypothetical protein [Simkaniaceae bacterium]
MSPLERHVYECESCTRLSSEVPPKELKLAGYILLSWTDHDETTRGLLEWSTSMIKASHPKLYSKCEQIAQHMLDLKIRAL